MAFKPNYNQQRAERNRAKELKKQEKLQRREEEVAARRAAGLPPEDGSDETVEDETAHTESDPTNNG